jgi:katanin p60 ATPase-containing subunit A1
MLTINKYDYESKINKEKRENERRKNILIVILKYLINIGLSETACSLQEESQLDLDKFDIADNIDLYMIICEYEEYFEMRFNKKPKFIVPILNKPNLPNIERKISRTNNTSDKRKSKHLIPITKKEQPAEEVKEIKLELVGQSVQSKKEDKEIKDKDKFTFNDQKESILLKPLPDHLFGNNELKELASLVKKYYFIN